MPFNYAHYRFAARLLPGIPKNVQSTVGRFRQLYDVGLHGPDIFMCRGPVLRKLSRKFHRQSGRDFFTRVVREIRLEPSEGALAYLYGLLTHYCLDSLCHPFVNAQVGPGHVEIESEFDRYLLEMDGKTPPHTQDLSRHIRLTPGGCETVARFYPPATAPQVQSCVWNMALFARVLATPEGKGRLLMQRTLGIADDRLSRFFMTVGPNPRCAGMNAQLLALYQQAEDRFPGMLQQLLEHLHHNAPLGEEFDPAFG